MRDRSFNAPRGAEVQFDPGGVQCNSAGAKYFATWQYNAVAWTVNAVAGYPGSALAEVQAYLVGSTGLWFRGDKG